MMKFLFDRVLVWPARGCLIAVRAHQRQQIMQYKLDHIYTVLFRAKIKYKWSPNNFFLG